MSLINDLKFKFRSASITQQLIYVNVSLFIITLIFSSFSGLYGNRTNIIYEWFSLSSSFNALLGCLLYTSPSPRDRTRSRMPSSA